MMFWPHKKNVLQVLAIIAVLAIGAAANSEEESYHYDPIGKRDPFLPYAKLREVVITEAKQELPVEPMQRWDVNQYKVIAIIWDSTRPRAVVKDPDGQMHNISPMAKFGKHDGYVASIREGELVIIEKIEDEGKITKVTRTLGVTK